MFSAGSLFDPYAIPHSDQENSPSQRDSRGRQVKDPRVDVGTGVFICAGQSNIGNWSEGSYSATNASLIDNLNIWDGGVYAATDPLLGPDGAMSNWTRRFADNLISGGVFTRVILVNCAMGASRSDEWVLGGKYYPRLLAAFNRCAALGLTPRAVLWQQGESDIGTSTAQYVANFTSMLSGVRAEGHNVPWLLGKSTWTTSGQIAAVRAAIDQLVSGDPLLYAGADTDDLTGSFRQTSPSPHFSATGAAQCALRWGAAWGEAAL